MTFDKINRRTHLYMGIALAPWFLLYAASSVVLNHGSWVKRTSKDAGWQTLFERDYQMAPFTEDSDPWELGEKLLIEVGMKGRYRAWFEDDNSLVVSRRKFISTIDLTYDPVKKRLEAKERKLPWYEAMNQAHFRAGYAFPYFADILWAAMIDLLVLATLLWIASGIYLWVRLGRFRFWGWAAILAGAASFVIVVIGL